MAIIPHCYPFLLPGEELFAMGDRYKGAAVACHVLRVAYALGHATRNRIVVG